MIKSEVTSLRQMQSTVDSHQVKHCNTLSENLRDHQFEVSTITYNYLVAQAKAHFLVMATLQHLHPTHQICILSTHRIGILRGSHGEGTGSPTADVREWNLSYSLYLLKLPIFLKCPHRSLQFPGTPEVGSKKAPDAVHANLFGLSESHSLLTNKTQIEETIPRLACSLKTRLVRSAMQRLTKNFLLNW